MVDFLGAEFDKPRVGSLVHVKQSVMDARVHAGRDNALDLRTLACEGGLVVAIATVGSDVASVSQGGGWADRAGVLGPGEDVAATRARVPSGPRRAGQPGSGLRQRGEWRRDARELRPCVCHIGHDRLAWTWWRLRDDT